MVQRGRFSMCESGDTCLYSLIGAALFPVNGLLTTVTLGSSMIMSGSLCGSFYRRSIAASTTRRLVSRATRYICLQALPYLQNNVQVHETTWPLYASSGSSYMTMYHSAVGFFKEDNMYCVVVECYWQLIFNCMLLSNQAEHLHNLGIL